METLYLAYIGIHCIYVEKACTYHEVGGNYETKQEISSINPLGFYTNY